MAAIFKIYMILVGIGVLGMVFEFIDIVLWATVDIVKDKLIDTKKEHVNRHRKVHHKTRMGV